ncbi:MAG: TrkH family potassium uptake protein [Burkholderiaceae bacterium]|jgi:trk system potassium uptake protein TrkH|nr:TrkH family potassium uptake protein [Burkholderiaceae bacterium]
MLRTLHGVFLRHAHVLLILSWLVLGFSLAFCVPLIWGLLDESMRQERIWLHGLLVTLGVGLALWLACRRYRAELSVKDGFLLVNLVWTVLPALAAVPLLEAIPGIGWTDAYFEAMSALTATGATVLVGLDQLDPAANLWRCFLQLIGGLGIMLLAVAVLPFLGLGGTQLFKAEMPGPMKDTRLTPRIAETARGLWGVYFLLSAACLLAYRWGGMSWLDAFMHMCTTVGLGGFSSHDQSFGYWNSPQLEWTAVVFMALAGVSFARYFMVWRLRSLRPLTQDAEVRAYALVLTLAVLAVWLLLALHGQPGGGGIGEQLRMAAFQVVSVATTTGYATTDYGLWPKFAPVLLLFLGTFVSCAGSTGGGIKMVRMLVLVKLAGRELVRAIHPRVVNPLTLGRVAVPPSVVWAIMAFMLIYGGCMVGLTLLLLTSGLDVVTAFTAVTACLNNIGPGLGKVGPASNYAAMTGFQIWVLTLAMLLGRLELISVLVLFTPQFWRR